MYISILFHIETNNFNELLNYRTDLQKKLNLSETNVNDMKQSLKMLFKNYRYHYLIRKNNNIKMIEK